MANQNLLFKFLLISAILVPKALSFVVSPQAKAFRPPSLATLHAKTKKGNQSGKGFGKEPVAPKPTSNKEDDTSTTAAASAEGSFLRSAEGGSKAIPTMEKGPASPTMDQDLPPEERAKKLLREQYGLRTLQEQRMEDQIAENRQRLDNLKKMADEGKDIDLMTIIPAPVLKGIDAFLKLGVGVCTVAFVLAGIAITVEAYSKVSGNALPANIDSFIVNTIEPNFTYGLLVLLGFSVSLGGFAALQLSSGAATYKEE